jgi:hypothetical protein
MAQPFWTHTIWYILLGITTITELAYVLIKADNLKLMFALFLTFSGIVYIIEIQVLLILKGYEYFPMIIDRISQIDDNILGNMFSQFSVAATALLISYLKLRKYWYFLCALFYGGIEELFLCLGIYKQHWYKTWMTVAGFTILLWLLNILYRKALRNPGRIYKYACAFFAVYTLFVHTITLVLRLIGLPPFKLLLPDEDTSVAINIAVNFLPLSISILTAYYKKLKWPFHAAIIAALYAVHYFAYALGFITYKGIFALLAFATLQIFGMYLFVHIVDRLYRFPKEKSL